MAEHPTPDEPRSEHRADEIRPDGRAPEAPPGDLASGGRPVDASEDDPTETDDATDADPAG